MTTIPNPADFGFDVRRYFHTDNAGQAPGTYWNFWDGHISANHVYEGQSHTVPPFTSGTVMAGTGLIDAVLVGCDLDGEPRPREPREKEQVFLYGYPGGSGVLSERVGIARFKRSSSGDEKYSIPTWTCMMADRPDDIAPHSEEAIHYEPVFVGMSGGLVMSEDGEALGILVGDGGPIDLDQDPELEQAFEFVALCDVWDVFASAGQNLLSDNLQVLVDRVVSDEDVTISRIYVNGNLICHGLEDQYQEHKVPKETRIPAGTYSLGVRTFGGMHDRYTRNYGSDHKGMLEVMNVPDFTDILIHVGNYDIDTDGCLLVGNADYDAMAVWQSKITYKKLYALLIGAALRGAAFIEFRDSDR